MTDVPDWTDPIALITAANPLTDLPDWSLAVIAAPGTGTTLGGGFGFYGDGSDGAQTFDGTTTILGIAPSASAYTLARDVFLASSTINHGVTIKPNGFRIFCSGTLTNNGTIAYNGLTGTLNAGGAALTNANSSITNATIGAGGGNGAVGANGGGGGTTGNAQMGGAGGAGGASTAHAGGAGGTKGNIGANVGNPRALPWTATALLNAEAGSLVPVVGGSGGGAGGGTAAAAGGGGGGGAGLIVICALAFAGTGVIQALGAPGVANGTNSGTGAGGGGGGGAILITSTSVSGGAISGQTISAAGGAGGTAPAGGGVNGTVGNAGNIVLLAN